ncbi:hybrid sensor histidine kinase/response regulator transcription factor [Mariniflexile sp. AS56]|uniref:hybrid sensor histidine kinase/response regulator transcription factor n=1 Tax=Mariniflexile sp. AS56 TaxID=3063957 RepID=UPI0026EB39AD|nr:hybrid sensor histidine kinase/response regulator transcription factor [Mariniflexile sp. AS56]MDO7173137.1 two-component regulator propeller domain-containing protein [Mariniflexile sp. AS56]
MIRRINHIVLVLFTFCGAFAQSNTLEYKQNLTITNGLAHNGVTSILEDSRGYLWVGTYDGLNKYDGYDLKTYKNTIDKDILVSNRVRTIAEDKKNNLWIGTDEGVSIYNYSTEQFSGLYSNKLQNSALSGPIVRKILINDKSGIIACATEGDGVLFFKQSQEYIGKFVPSKELFGDTVLFYDGIDLDNNNFIFTTSSGLMLFNIQSKEFQKILNDEVAFSNSILKIDNQTLLVTLQYGIAILDFKSNKDSYSFKVLNKDFDSEQFNSSLLDSLGNLWLGSLNTGLLHIEDIDSLKNKRPFKTSTYKPERGILRSSAILAVSNYNCWYGTFNEGLFRFDINENPFKKYSIEMDYDFGIKSNNVTSISALDDKRVYIATSVQGTGIGGLALFNTQSHNFEPIPFKISKEDIAKVQSVFVDKNKNVWLKIVQSGLYRVRTGTTTMESIKSKNDQTFNFLSPRSYTEDRYGNLWIGSARGAYKITMNKDSDIMNIESLNDNPFFKNSKLTLARFIYADPLYDFIWLGADADGLFRININEDLPIEKIKVDQFVHDKKDKFSISSSFVTSIIRVPNEEFWIGTEGGGICKVLNSQTNPKFISYSEKQGLSNNVVKSVLFDNEYNLWISTNVGLNKFDTKDFSFRRFGMSDGLPFDDFWFASAKLNNGYFLFSGLDGLCYFNPKKLPDNEAFPRLEFGDVKIFNKTVLPGDTIAGRVLYNKYLTDRDELELKYNENVFSIQLTSLHFLNPDNHNLKYRLMPVNPDWIEVPSHQQTVYYNGLQPGEYKLEVMASNSFNDWTEPKILNITITPPFWKTWYAYLLYFLLALLLIYSVVKIVLRIQRLNHNLQIEHLEKNQAKEINAAKLRFFSNISHELKTPLTLIGGPVNMLLEQFKNNTDIKEKLQIVKRQSKKISLLVNQVHDFQKAEANALKMNYSRFYFNEFIKEICLDFSFMAENDNKELLIEAENNNIIVSADRDKLEKVFNNILSNAFKYTKANDSIKVTFRSDDKDLIVSVSDTGKGIDSEDLAHVFERFYQSHKYENVHTSGSGIGLAFSKLLVEMHYGYISAESELGKGTLMKIRLPIVKKETAEDQPKTEEVMLLAEKGFEFKKQLLPQNNPSNIKIDGSFSESLIFYAEDNSDMRKFVSNVLSKYFKLKTFSNGQECLDAMEDEWPDVVISDVQMPELNGLDLCRQIKSDIKTSHIPVILLTALTNIDDKIQGIRDGADAYIKKPFNVQHLITRTESLLNNRKQLRERFQIGIPLTKENNLNNRNDNAFLEKLYNLIDENLDNQNLDLNDFTKELYLNRTHFYQKVKALTNLTPFEVLKDYRLKKAAEFLVQKKVSVNEVYAMTGFKSRTHFSKLFKERYDVTPGKYASELEDKYNF